MSTTLFHTADLLHSKDSLSVQWRSAPGEVARNVEAATQERISQQLKELAEAERALGPTASPRLAAAQHQLGLTLYHLLDGPERALQRRVESARSSGQPLHLIIRLRSSDRHALARHPALGWQLQLLTCPAEGPLALMPGITVSVQLGEVEPTQRVLVPGGRLQVLFMAYSPRDTQPVLDYEGEEERILTQLAPFIEERRLLLRVAEEGTLAELRRRLMRRPYDIVHLTGHGVVTDKGPRLLMEDETGAKDDISPEQLLKALRDGRKMPRLVVISSCHSADQRDDLPSLAAELIQGGIPCVVGWTRPVLDRLATEAAAELYHRLCSGEVPAEAVARARQHLQEEDKKKLLPTHTWATLQYLTTQPAGFALDPDEPPARDASPTPEVVYRMLGSRMRVLERGFVGRRRELQALGRILRWGRWLAPDGAESPVAGATIVGMKGQGKSCLVGRALERFSQDLGELTTVVLHGKLSEFELLEAFRQESSRSGDDKAEALLADSSQPWMKRLERLLRHHWRERRMVVVLDDFEQNLDIPAEGEAQLQPLAAELLEVLVPVCREEQPKVLITTTARFTLPTRCQGALAELTLGSLDTASINKLWMRGQNGGELVHMPPSEWAELCKRLGRNARILDWARQLLGGKTPKEVREILDKAGQKLPKWQGEVPDKAKQDELAALFLKHMALEEAQAKVGKDALAFVERARVYEVPVPAEALSRLTEGLTVSLEHHLVALANLGLLEVGSEEGQAVYRVSPLVKEKFDAPEGEKWHGVAAEFWWKAADRGDRWHTPALFQAWEHALQAKRQDIADEVADILNPWLDSKGEYKMSAGLGMRHITVFPESVTGMNWAGYALHLAGEPHKGCALLEQGVGLAATLPADNARRDWIRDNLARVLASLGEHAKARQHFEELIAGEEQRHPVGSQRLSGFLHALAGVLQAQGDLAAARSLLERSVEILKQVLGTELHPDVAVSLNNLAGVLKAQGDLAAARSLLERSLEIKKQVLGTELHPSVAASLHALAGVLQAQGDLAAARSLLERSVEILKQVLGTELHPDVAASLNNLAGVLKAQGDLAAARSLLERSLEIKKQVLGTELHPSVAASLHALAGVLQAQGDLAAARSLLERSLEIKKQVLGTELHPDVAASLHALAGVLKAQGDLAAARSLLERSLEILKQVLGTELHPSVATSLNNLAGVLKAQGDLAAARSLLERSLEIKKQVLGTELHPSVAASLHALAGVLQAQGDLAAARSLLERSVEIDKQVLGTELHPDVAASLHELAGVLQAQGDLAAARSLLERSLEIKKQVLGTELHPSVATSYASLGVCLHELGNLDEGETALRKAQAIRERVYGTRDHYMYAETEFSLAFLLFQRERQEEALPLLLHAMAVLQAQVPNHPLLVQLRGMFSGARVNPPDLARLALTARASGTTPPHELIEGLQFLRDAGAPHNVVADFLEQVAGGGPLPPVPADLPEEVAAFLASVREAAEGIPASA